MLGRLGGHTLSGPFGMNVHPIPLNLQLPGDKLLDLFLFQWHTPEPLVGGTLSKIQSPQRERKQHVLEQFRDWVLDRNVPSRWQSDRPLILVVPEASLAVSHIGILEDLLDGVERPTVVVAGIEHLTWVEYEDLCTRMADTPQRETCPPEATAGRFVNVAGIWVRDLGGRVSRYLQSKLHPSYLEEASLHPGQNVLVFHSLDQTSGVRLNFCVQICSDFCSEAFVKGLRRGIESSHPNSPLDFVFLIQLEPDPPKSQFRESIKAWFDSPDRMVQTQEGCIVIANTARVPADPSPCGGSGFCFPRSTWWLSSKLPQPQHTFWIRDDGEYEHQAVVAREPGPGVYWATYKPHYLGGFRLGRDECLPFPASRALFMPLGDGRFTEEAGSLVLFPILPVPHWLATQWRTGRGEFSVVLREKNRPPDVVASCEEAYSASLAQWDPYVSDHWELCGHAVQAYFRCWQGEEAYPHKEPEPFKWRPEVSEGCRRMMQAYSLLKLGERGACSRALEPECNRLGVHARFGPDVQVVFLWGNGKRGAEAMIAACRTPLEVSLQHSRVLLALVDPDPDEPYDARDLTEKLRLHDGDLTEVEVSVTGEHLQEEGRVINPKKGLSFNLIHNYALLREVYGAADRADVKTRLETVLRSELE